MANHGMFRLPDEEQVAAETEHRERQHEKAEAAVKGRKPRADRERTKGLGLKVTDEKMEQLVRLTKLTRWTQTDIIEAALDVFEEAWKKGKVR